MVRAFRNVLVSVLSACLICSPLFSFKIATAASAGDSQPNQTYKSPGNSLAAHEPNTLLVRFHSDKITQAEYLINTFSKRHERLRGPSEVIKLTLKDDRELDATLRDLRQLDAVIAWVEPNFIVKRAGIRGTGVRSTGFSRKRPSSDRLKAELPTIIAVIDSGVDLRHRALKHHLWLNQSEKSGAESYDDDLNDFIDDTRGWNFVADNNDVSDDIGHGAQVAGVIASQLDRQSAISILPLKALNHTGEGTVADVVEAMDYAVARRAAVINCSFGAPAFSHAMLEAIKRAEMAGIVVVAAAGNRGRSISESPFYPASYRAHQAPNLISVAATDRNQLLAGFSNFAADIAAPGESIRTAHLGNSYISMTGTSASAGFVAAAAGLLKSVRGWVSAQTIRQTIIESADESFDLKDKVAGKGALNAAAALSLFTRDHVTLNPAPGSAKHNSLLASAVAAQSSANLDTMRSSQPQAPNAYQQTGTLPPAATTIPNRPSSPTTTPT